MEQKNLKAFLLAAGLGTRLRPISDYLPKCLLPIEGKPLLQIWLELMGRHGVGQVLVNTHWLHKQVEQYVEELEEYKANINKKPRPVIRLCYEKELLGSAGTLLANKSWLADGRPFFILYADNLTNVDLKKIYAFHCQHGYPFTLGVFEAEEPNQCGIAEVDQNGVVVNFVEKPENPKSNLAAAGIYVADQRIFDFFPPASSSLKPLDLGYHVLPNLVKSMKAYFIEELLIDIGTPQSYENAQKVIFAADEHG